MKGQLYIGDDMVAETVEVVSSPRSGDLIIFEGKRLRIREVGHNVDRKKLQIMCHVPPAPAEEPIAPVVTFGPYEHDLTAGELEVAKDILGIDLTQE